MGYYSYFGKYNTMTMIYKKSQQKRKIDPAWGKQIIKNLQAGLAQKYPESFGSRIKENHTKDLATAT
ncbi:MAG TPA: hypothetical protein VG935_03215 [Patescibacteria group bacterium]|nr:hypothetical protein [Patescibacteria group bacterium]